MPTSALRLLSPLLLGLGLLIGIGTQPGEVCAQSLGSVPDSVRQAALADFHGADLQGKDGPLAKAGMDLLLLYHLSSARRVSDFEENAAPEGIPDAMQVRNGRVVVDAIAANDVAALRADLESLGMTGAASAGQIVSGSFPIARIPDLARLETLQGVRPALAKTQSANSKAGRGGGATTGALRPGQIGEQDADRQHVAGRQCKDRRGSGRFSSHRPLPVS